MIDADRLLNWFISLAWFTNATAPISSTRACYELEQDLDTDYKRVKLFQCSQRGEVMDDISLLFIACFHRSFLLSFKRTFLLGNVLAFTVHIYCHSACCYQFWIITLVSETASSRGSFKDTSRLRISSQPILWQVDQAIIWLLRTYFLQV